MSCFVNPFIYFYTNPRFRNFTSGFFLHKISLIKGYNGCYNTGNVIVFQRRFIWACSLFINLQIAVWFFINLLIWLKAVIWTTFLILFWLTFAKILVYFFREKLPENSRPCFMRLESVSSAYVIEARRKSSIPTYHIKDCHDNLKISLRKSSVNLLKSNG